MCEHHFVLDLLLSDVFQCVEIGHMLLALVVFGRNKNTADGEHLPLEPCEALVGLQTVQVRDGSVASGYVQIEIITNIEHPFGYNLAKL